MTTATRTLLCVLAGVFGLGACSNDSPAETAVTPESTAAPATMAAPDTGSESTDAPVEPVAPNGIVVEVQSIDNTFRPETIEIEAGTEVHWTNVGRNEHNIIPVEGDDWGVATEDFAPKDEYSHVFGVPGTYAYYCSIHGTADVGMIGTVVVTG